MAAPGMTTPSAVRYDPLTAFCFSLVIDGWLGEKEAFFKSIGGLKSESEVVPYREGGLNNHTHQLVGPTKWPNLVLKRGFVAAGGPADVFIRLRQIWTDPDNNELVRLKGRIIQYNSKMTEICNWKFRDGWPCKWEGPDYDATKSELAVETLEIAHSGLFYEAK